MADGDKSTQRQESWYHVDTSSCYTIQEQNGQSVEAGRVRAAVLVPVILKMFYLSSKASLVMNGLKLKRLQDRQDKPNCFKTIFSNSI